MVLVPAKTTKRKTTVAQASPAKKTKVTPAKKTPAAKTKGGKRGSPTKNNAEDEEEEVEETEEVEEEGSGNEEEAKEGEEEEGDDNEEGDEEGGEGDEQENAGDTTAEGEGETKAEATPSPIKKGNGPSKLEAYVFQNLNPQTSIADVHRSLRMAGIDTGIVNASIIVEFKPNVPKNFLENAAKVSFGGDNEKFSVGKFKPLEIAEYVDNIPPPPINWKQWLKISVLDLEEGTTKEDVKAVVEEIVGEEVKVDTGNATSMVVTFQSEKSFGKLLVHDDLKVKDKAVRLKIPFATNISRNNMRRSDFSPRKNGVSGSPVRGGRGGNMGGGYGGGRGGGFFGGPKRGGRGTARMGGGFGGYGGYMRPY